MASIWGEVKDQDWYKALAGVVVGIDAASQISNAPANQQMMLNTPERPQGDPNVQPIDPKRVAQPGTGMDSKLLFYGALGIAALGLAVVIAK